MSVLLRLATLIGRWFALVVLIAAVVGLVLPGPASALGPYISLLLGIIMFGMGLTLRARDFGIVARHPLAVVLGVCAQYVVMPLLGWAIGTVFGFGPALLVGLILVGAAPGGTASNVVVYLARGDVALSVAMTSISTLLAPLLTPLLVLWLAGSTLSVDAIGMFWSIVQVVLLPVAAGIVVRALLPRVVAAAVPFLPIVSVLGIACVVAGVVGGNAETVLSSGLVLIAAVVVHNGLGLLIGYFAARLTGIGEAGRRAVAVEVGMQNSGLAASLATAHFSPLTALPAAVFSVWHNLSGAAVAAWWARRQPTSSDPSASAAATGDPAES